MSGEIDDYEDIRGPFEPHRGTMILVLGILGVLVCGFIGTFAWVFGKRDLDLMRRGLMDSRGETFTRAGYIMGIVGTIFGILQTLFIALYAGLIGFLLAR
jgi:hypothetical protein